MFLINIFVYFMYLVLSGKRVATDALTQYGDGICISKHPIPLDEKSFTIEFVEWEPIQLLDFDKIPDSTILENNGKTLVITMNYSGNVPTVAMGPFQDTGPFRFDHLYWHWLKSLSSDRVTIPIELHLVFYDATYASLKEAAKQSDSIAILAHRIMALRYGGGTEYQTIVEELASIGVEGNMQTALSPDKMLPLRSYASTNTRHYSTYKGSWDANLCTGRVIWVDFLFPVVVHPEFLYELEHMHGFNNQSVISQSVKTNPPQGVVHEPTDGLSKILVNEGTTGKFPNSIGVYLIFCVIYIQFINVSAR